MPVSSEGFQSIMLCSSDADVGAALQAWAAYGQSTQPIPEAGAAAAGGPQSSSQAEQHALLPQVFSSLGPLQAWQQYRSARGGTLKALWGPPAPRGSAPGVCWHQHFAVCGWMVRGGLWVVRVAHGGWCMGSEAWGVRHADAGAGVSASAGAGDSRNRVRWVVGCG